MAIQAKNKGSCKGPMTKDAGPSVRVLQLNIEGISAAKSDYLQKILHDNNIDIVNVQETHTRDDADLHNRGHIPGYTLIKALHHLKYGIATYAKSSLKEVQIVHSNDDNNIFTIVIQVATLTIVNIYKPPCVTWPSEILPVYDHPSLYTGDFNSHHTDWRYEATDQNGSALSRWAELTGLHLVFDAKDKGTFHSARWKKDYNPDLTFISKDSLEQPFPVTRRVLSDFPRSQHRPVVLEIGIKIPLSYSMPLPRWNFKRANWNGYRDDLESLMANENLEPIAANYHRLTELIIKAAKRNIPRGYRKEYVPGWNPESEFLFKEYQRTGDHSIGTKLLQSLDDNHRQKWQSVVSSMNFTRSSRKAWRTLHSLTGKYHPPKLNSVIKPDAIAARMVEMTRAKRDKVFTKSVKKELSALKRSPNTNPELSRPFDIHETIKAIKLLKNNKAAGPDNIFNEFLQHMGPCCVRWLAAFFTNILFQNRLPREFKLAKVIAILKPGKPVNLAESYRPIALLSCTLKLLERMILTRIMPYTEAVIPPEQAGFRGGRSCTDQVLSLTTHIEVGFQAQMKSTAVFIDLTAAYDTVWRQGLIYKLIKVIPSMEIVNLISSMLSEREFEVFLGDCKSKKKKLNNGLPQGSVLAPTLFNIYIHDLPPTTATKFIYADDIALVSQSKNFKAGENVLTDDLSSLAKYFRAWRLIPSASKTEVCCFHLSNQLATYQPNVFFAGVRLKYNAFPKYLGVTLDRTLTYKEHLHKLSLKVGSRNSIVQKLCGTSWGASADCLRTSSLALTFSAAEYCAPVWLQSAHVHKIDTKLNDAMRCISGTLRSTPCHWLPVLSHIAPAHLRRKNALRREVDKINSNPDLQANKTFCNPPPKRLKSRRAVYSNAHEVKHFNLKDCWREEWKLSGGPLSDPTIKPEGFHLPRKLWCRLNRLRTGHGRCNYLLHKWGWKPSAICDCGEEEQTIQHIIQRCPLRSYQGSPGDLFDLPPQFVDWLGNLDIDL